MMHEALGVVWYILLVVLWVGFIVQESFTSGIGMIFMAKKSEKEGRVLQYTVGPYWDGTEVWFITAGGATFAAFPLVYADMFSNLYIALYLLLVMFITRGVAMELVYKDDGKAWQKGMSIAWVISSYGVALLLGVRFSNLFLKANTLPASTNDFFGLLSMMGILGGLLFIATYRTSGILWANLKAKGDVIERVKKQVLPSAILSALVTPILMMGYNWDTQLFATNYRSLPVLWVLPILTMVMPILTIIALRKKRYRQAFITNTLLMVFFLVTGYTGIFPYMAPGITVYDGMASKMTLTIMTWVAAVFVPLILGYQGWKFWRFRYTITEDYFKEI